ncbi:MAG: hypothetical protein AAGD11_05210 [Planctomycetota bacterium]
MSSFVNLMQNVPPPFNMVVYIFLIIGIGSVLTSLMKQIRKYACHRQELDFKRELIDRGMDPDEIEQVVRARAEGPNRIE